MQAALLALLAFAATAWFQIGPGYLERRDLSDPENVSELVQNLQNPLFPVKSIVVS